jgi:N-acetylglutamate synthase-like GNAT family acetyltransferase
MNVAENIERGAIDGCRDCVTAARDVAPHLNADMLEIAGGIAGFAGAGSPLSEATGLGVFADATPNDVAHLTTFYLERGSAPRITVSPLAALTLTDALVRDGYRPVEYQNVLVREIAEADGARDERIGIASDHYEWGHASAAGFMERKAEDDEALIGTIIARAATMIPLEARVDGSIVATAAMTVRGRIAGLHGASTLPFARRRGWQNVLIRDRIARARELGARYVYGLANVGGGSERNFRRLGFNVLHTQTVWER